MPPKKKSSSKTKKKRSDAAVMCGHCAARVSKRERIQCICTRVVFCSEPCRAAALRGEGKHDCPGPPKTKVDVSERVEQIKQKGAWINDKECQEWNEEYKNTVTLPLVASGGISANPEDYIRRADKGNVAAAYMVGISYKQRLMGEMRLEKGKSIVMDTAKSRHGQLGVLQTDELAFHYLSLAAEARHGLAMQSLADCYEYGVGVRKDARLAKGWLWSATLQNSTRALSTLDSKCVLGKEFLSQVIQLDQMPGFGRLEPGKSICMLAPNIASLLLALNKDIIEMDYTLPPFASSNPTQCIGTDAPRNELTGNVPLLGASVIKQVIEKSSHMAQGGIKVMWTYGRRGVAKEATSQCMPGGVSRSLDSHLYVVPPSPVCDDTPDGDQIYEWVRKVYGYTSPDERIYALCTHIKGTEAGKGGSPICKECIHEARKRLKAVACGSVVLSLQEFLPARGHTVIFRQTDGQLRAETFKDYSRGEVECVLAVLAAVEERYGPMLAHPIFVAQDPNLFWPIIMNHGSVRAALEYVAPHKDWGTKLGCPLPVPTQVPVATTKGHQCKPGDIFRKCGNENCLELEPDSKSLGAKLTFSCGQCKRRYYCSEKCANLDWTLHKRECNAAASGSAPTPLPVEPPQPSMGINDAGRAFPEIGDEVVVHSLSSRPEFNGLVGVISDNLQSNGRYPVKLSCRKNVLAIKPGNLYFGARIKKRRKKSRKFECAQHGLELCSSCWLDFTSLNHLSRTSYANGVPNKEVVENVSETHFAAVGKGVGCEGGGLIVGKLDADYPMECQGLPSDTDARHILSALLGMENLSLPLAATVAGMSCYGARSCLVARQCVSNHLMTVLNTEK